MIVDYDDLVAYLEESEDWRPIHENPLWLNFEGPLDAMGVPLPIVLPRVKDDLSTAIYLQTAVATLAAVHDLPLATMAERITPTSVQALMDAIKYFDCEPAVFRVSLMASDRTHGYDACVDFRTSSSPKAASLATHAHTPELALRGLLTELKAKWGRCPRCGLHLDGREKGEKAGANHANHN